MSSGGYAWSFQRAWVRRNRTRVIPTMTDKNAQWHLDQFIKHFFKERFRNSRILEIQGGGGAISPAHPIRRQPHPGGRCSPPRQPHYRGHPYRPERWRFAGNFLADFNQGDQPTPNLKAYQDGWLKDRKQMCSYTKSKPISSDP